MAFESARHSGALGKSFELLKVSDSRVRVLALKKAEKGDEAVLRMVELDGRPAPDVRIGFAGAIAAAREINGAEEPAGAATVTEGKLVTSFTPFQPRTFALKLAPPATKVAAVESKPLTLSYDLAVASNDETKAQGGFDADGRSLPAEMLPANLSYHGIQFSLAPARTGTPNAVVAKGQTIDLPEGKFNRVYVLAASADGDRKVTFRIGDKPVELTIQAWGGFIGQWDDRVWESSTSTRSEYPGGPELEVTDRFAEMLEIKPGFIKPSSVAWFSSHRHTADGKNEPYSYSYLYAYPVDVPANAKTLTLPDDDKIRILAISAVGEGPVVNAVQPLCDTLERTQVTRAAQR
jgi:alpha-mannosidase